jgi:hypothetical protein
MRLLSSLVIGLTVLCVNSLTAAPIIPAVQCTATPGAIVLTPTDVLFLNPTWKSAGFQCQQDDKIFSDFTSAGVPTDVTMRLTLQGTGPSFVDTITFAGDLSTAFTVMYTITVAPPSTQRIVQATADLANPGHNGNPSLTKTVTELAPGTFTGSTTASFLGGGGAPISIVPAATSLRVTDAYTPNGGAATSFGDSFIQSAVPEPATETLFGAGLLALGLTGSWRRRKTS